MTAYAIRKGVPLPETRGRPAVYPFAEMAVGDCFDVPCEPSKRKGKRNTVATSVQAWRRKHGPDRRFTVRFIAEENLIRVWRIK